jgi:hypothetical protein
MAAPASPNTQERAVHGEEENREEQLSRKEIIDFHSQICDLGEGHNELTRKTR